MNLRRDLKDKARALKRNVLVLSIAARDPRMPWRVKVFVICIVAYALSPIDLIPDFIPILGYLDDLLLLPLAIYFVLKSIPRVVLDDARKQAETMNEILPQNWLAGGVIIFLWIAALIVTIAWIL